MAKQVLNNLDTFGVQRGKLNSNFDELYDVVDSDKDSFASIYLPAAEQLDPITPGTPISPTTLSIVGVFNFTYTGGSLVYSGTKPVIVKVDGAVSMISNTNNIIVTASFGKNGVSDSKTEIDRKIQTGADVGAIPIAGTFTLNNGDFLDFFVDVDNVSTITMTKANFTIHTLKIA